MFTAYRNSTKLIAVLLCVTLLAGLAPAAWADDNYTCREAAALIAENADAYSDNPPTAEELLSADIDPDAALTNALGCELIYRAFGTLPEATGVRYLAGYWDTAFTDVPEACAAAVSNLTDAGIYIPEDDTLFLPDAAMTQEELSLLISRIHAYLGTSLRDDYYTAVNSELLFGDDFLDAQPLDTFYTDNSTDEDNQLQWVMDLFSQCMDAEGGQSPAQQRVAAFLSTYYDQETRSQGLGALADYIAAIKAAADPAALLDTLAVIANETGANLLFLSTDVTTDVDGTLLHYFAIITPTYPASYYVEGQTVYASILEQDTKLFTMLGYTDAEAMVQAEIDFYYKLASAQSTLDPQDSYVFSAETLDEMFPLLSLSRYFTEAGYEHTEQVIISDIDAVSRFAQVFTEDTLEGWKAICIKNLLDIFWLCVPPDFADAICGFWAPYFAADTDNYYDISYLYYYVVPRLATDLCQIYLEENDISALKENISWLFSEYTDIFSADIRALDWMSDETKAAALEKLAAMELIVLQPDDMPDFQEIDYVAKEDGGTLLYNMILYRLASRARSNARIGETTTSQDAWLDAGILSNNAFYSPDTNSVIVPLGFVIGRNYSASWPVEKQLAIFGFALGHEMTHGFDSTGMFYGADGSVEIWWTDEDYEKYQEKCQAVIDYYAGVEFLPGFALSSASTLNENIADMGSIKRTLTLAAAIEDFDYDVFFREFASQFALSSTRRAVQRFLLGDSHSLGCVRVNRLLSLCDAFYTIYGIEPGDAMYVALEDRVSVW